MSLSARQTLASRGAGLMFLGLMAGGLALSAAGAKGEVEPVNARLVPTPSATSATNSGEWKLVWQDEFEGSALDETKWSHRQVGPREGAMIAKECVSLDGRGHLVMTVFEKDGVLQNPMIGTQKKLEPTYGKFAARIKFPEQQGQHGSFWMQPAVKSTAVNNPALTGAEIDIIEWFGAGRPDGGTASNLYWHGPSGPKEHHAGGTKPFGLLREGEKLSDDFHVFAVEWSPEGYVFSMDDQVTYRIREGVSRVPQYMILSLLTADWEKDRLDRTKLPDSMLVDWVRVWQKDAAPVVAEKISFNHDVRPIFSDKCFACHGTDAKHREAGLRLDTPEGAYQNNDGVIAITPGDLKKSEAWLRIITDDEDDVMPPPKSHKTLSKAEKDLIRRWIEQGAGYEKHWSFEPPVKVSPPPVKAKERVRNPIDAFLFSKLDQLGLAPSPEADKATLIRRATLAITGLPPTPEEVDAFLADASPDAYKVLVDRLLDSRRFGEHMAHWWLDLARYGDTHGLHLDNERSIWLYRDWVIGAFNRNLPFDRFTIEQLAGDQLPDATNEQKIASGFNRCNVTTSEGGAIGAEFLFRYALDRTATTAQTWLGLTVQCAACHDHKFDPISQKEVYQLYAFFNSTADPAMDGNKMLTEPVLKNGSPEQMRQLTELGTQIAAAQKKLTEAVASVDY
ncbi:DUF1549 domain-containing protein [Verrucomicrobium sp. BvORR106]|uniref:DUF1549 domain-containing protein n=1 Tax=Verrucomicrobium sp. BvORR106 TaxID=1403819 RepID=UPI002240F4E7|nr:DUF1549 domain-containing protein [Verrucomicrobium sp. BvORR106]